MAVANRSQVNVFKILNKKKERFSMSCCLVMMDERNVLIGADSAISSKIGDKFVRTGNNMKKLYRFGDEIAFVSGNLSYVNYIINRITMRGNKIDKDELQELLRSLEYPAVINDIISVEILIAGVDNGKSYLYVFSQRNDFEKDIKYGSTTGVQFWCAGIQVHECMKESEKAFLESHDTITTYINTYKRIASECVGGFINMYQITPYNICKLLDNYNIHDGYKVCEVTSHLIPEDISLSKIEQRNCHAIICEAMVGKMTLSERLMVFNKSGNMKFTDDGISIEDNAKNNRFAVKPNDSENFLDISLNNGQSSLNFDASGFRVKGANLGGLCQEVIISPNSDAESILNVKSNDTDVLKFNEEGDLEITGKINATSGKVSMFEIEKGDAGLSASFEGSGTKQYGLRKNRFFAFFRNAANKFVGHIDLDNGVEKDDDGETHLGLSLGSVGNVSILSNSKIQFGNHVYDDEGVASWTVGATIDGASGRIETNDVVKYNGTIRTTRYANTCAFDSTGMIKQYVSSSKRYKHDITEGFDETTDYRKLLELPVVTYRYNEGYCDDDNGELHIGFIAEDIDKLFPVGCNYKDGQPENWNVMEMVPAILKLVQEQNKAIHKLMSEIGRLKEDLKSMQ